MKTEFPIYAIDFTLYGGEHELAGCEQSMMILEEMNHNTALASLRRMVADLSERLFGGVPVVTSWSGSITYLGLDSWCYHWNSFYTWRHFSDPESAMADLLCWVIENDLTDVVDTEMSTWRVCTCDSCKALQRTVVLYGDENTCGS